MESVKSIVKYVVYGKSKIHTNMEFTFSNNKFLLLSCLELEFYMALKYNIVSIVIKLIKNIFNHS